MSTRYFVLVQRPLVACDCLGTKLNGTRIVLVILTYEHRIDSFCTCVYVVEWDKFATQLARLILLRDQLTIRSFCILYFLATQARHAIDLLSTASSIWAVTYYCRPPVPFSTKRTVSTSGFESYPKFSGQTCCPLRHYEDDCSVKHLHG